MKSRSEFLLIVAALIAIATAVIAVYSFFANLLGS